MKVLLATLLVALYASLNFSCISTSEVVVENKGFFPTVSGSNLNGEDKTLPAALEKENTIVNVAFKREQQELCDGWYKHISEYMSEHENTAYFEIPTISKLNPFVRWFIYEGMKGGIKDTAMRGQVITLHIDKEPFKKALGIESEDTVYTYVLSPSGEIRGNVSGEWTKEKWEQLMKLIKK